MSTGSPRGPGAPGAALTTSAPRLRRALLAAFFAALGASLTTPVSDPDFWWHLASGRWMWERGELLRTLGACTLAALLLVALACRAIVHDLSYIGDRPQMWSSLLFVAVMLLCRRQREGRRWAFLAVPPVMLIWSNFHGGYLLGLLAVWLSAAADWSFGKGSRRSLLSAACP